MASSLQPRCFCISLSDAPSLPVQFGPLVWAIPASPSRWRSSKVASPRDRQVENEEFSELLPCPGVEDATNGAQGIATNGTIGRYVRGSWPYYGTRTLRTELFRETRPVSSWRAWPGLTRSGGSHRSKKDGPSRRCPTNNEVPARPKVQKRKEQKSEMNIS